MHPLLKAMLEAAEGRFPPADGGVSVVPPYDPRLRAVISFTGHSVIAGDVDAAEAAAHGADGFGGAMKPAALTWLAGPDGHVGDIDATLVGRGRGGGSGLTERPDLMGHPRVAYALSQRREVRVFGDDRGLTTLAKGIAGRLEISVEAAEAGRGAGRGLVEAALGEVAAGAPVFAGVSPGNARSLRMFLALGFTPICAEAVIRLATGR